MAVCGGLLEGDDLGVVAGVVVVGALTDDLSFLTRTQPTWGLGLARPTEARARSRARCMNCWSSSSAMMGIPLPLRKS